MELQHCSHEHPLMFIDEVQNEEGWEQVNYLWRSTALCTTNIHLPSFHIPCTRTQAVNVMYAEKMTGSGLHTTVPYRKMSLIFVRNANFGSTKVVLYPLPPSRILIMITLLSLVILFRTNIVASTTTVKSAMKRTYGNGFYYCCESCNYSLMSAVPSFLKKSSMKVTSIPCKLNGMMKFFYAMQAMTKLKGYGLHVMLASFI
ncbi:hypothetical protein LguiB_033538 [Lonicera macranthoides]